jgi:hypothetical protein
MENKQKPSLFLVGNHLKIEEPGIPFTEDMLGWPIISFTDYPEPCVNLERNTILRNALGALSRLSPFHVKISITAELENKRLSYENRTWGKIFLNEENVLTFSHDSTEEKKPFSNLEDWVEKEVYIGEQGKLVALAKWSTDNWIKFFKEKIVARAVHLKNKAKRKKEDADDLEKSADIILMSIVITSIK